ncbi:MAG TPA: hypothetical protein PKK31_10895 [Elusimicrobiales bacterium]|nr:hypothetical protein [Elusimicrobiales bacterium]
MATPFSQTLVKLRKEAGFGTAYSFFHDNGGAPALKISYRNYLHMEQGKLLPVFSRLRLLLYPLRLVHRSSEAAGLVLAWLRTMAGDEPFEELISPLLAPRKDVIGVSPMHKAAKKALDSRKYYLNAGQTRVITADDDTYLCYVALSNDTGAWKVRELAGALKMPEARAAKALAALKREKVVRETRKGVFRCPFAGMMIEFPHLATLPRDMHRRMDELEDRLERSGRPVWLRSGIIRADAGAFRDFLPVMGLNISTAQTYAVTEKSADSALFFIGGRVTKIRDF